MDEMCERAQKQSKCRRTKTQKGKYDLKKKKAHKCEDFKLLCEYPVLCTAPSTRCNEGKRKNLLNFKHTSSPESMCRKQENCEDVSDFEEDQIMIAI